MKVRKRTFPFKVISALNNFIVRRIFRYKKRLIKSAYSTRRTLINSAFSFIILVLRIFVKIIIVDIFSERIGHLAFCTDLFLRKLQLKNENGFKKIVYIGICQSPSANEQLLRMFSRKLFIIPIQLKYYEIIKESIKDNKLIYENSNPMSGYSHFLEFNNTSVNLIFSKEEEEHGTELLAEMGIGDKDWFVCFHNRDSLYLEKNAKMLYGTERDWSYHDYRDSSIKTFIPAAEYIVKKGGFAIRMGRDAAEKLPGDLHPHIIDYAQNHWSDFGDIYLSAKCAFFLGSNAGLSVVPYIFHKPMIMTNYTPMFTGFSPRLDNIAIPCKIYSIKEERYLSFREIFNSEINHWGSGHQFAKAGLEVLPSNEEEILDVTKEMYARVFTKGYEYTDDDKELRDQFRSLYPPTHECYDTPVSEMISIDFLRKNEVLIK